MRPNAVAATAAALLHTTNLDSHFERSVRMSYPALLLADPTQAFDFLIAGELLRQPLEKFLLAHSVSTVSIHIMQAE